MMKRRSSYAQLIRSAARTPLPRSTIGPARPGTPIAGIRKEGANPLVSALLTSIASR